MLRTRYLTLCALALTIGVGASRPRDDIDAFIEAEMAKREIAGLSLVIIDDGRIAETRAYGVKTRGGSERVTPATLFQAGSISKPVAALGALQLVEKGVLGLDEDVNTKLKSWKVPDNEFTTTERVTLRRLLSHTAGLTVHGFPGYATDATVPSVPAVLDGQGNTAAVRVNVVPGTIWRYSGGGYTVMQQLVTDVTGKPFPEYMRDNVLRPLGMTSSSYEQPLPADMARRTAAGHRVDRSTVRGRWHVYPEMAAAGLWTTPTDLARYAIGVQQMLAGKSKVLSADIAKQMLTEQKGNYGLGPGVAGSGETLRFSHGGRDEGFDAWLEAYAHSGDGVVIMINANDNSRAMRRIINFIAKKYAWPSYPLPAVEPATAVHVVPAALNEIAGRYEFSNNIMMTLIAQDGRLYTDVSGLPDEAFVPVGPDRFVSTERAISLRAERNEQGHVTNLELTGPNLARDIARIGPLFGPSNGEDPDTALTGRALEVLRQLARGGTAVTESTLLTPGARPVFKQANPQLDGVTRLTFVHVEDLTGRNVQRHGHPVARTVHYRMHTADGLKLLLVHVDPAGMIADYDIVVR